MASHAIPVLVHRKRAPISTCCHLPSDCVLPFFNFLKQPALPTTCPLRPQFESELCNAENGLAEPAASVWGAQVIGSDLTEAALSLSPAVTKGQNHRPLRRRISCLPMVAFIVVKGKSIPHHLLQRHLSTSTLTQRLV